MLRKEYLAGYRIGITMYVFQIYGIRQDVTESLKSAVRYSIIVLGARCIRLKMLSLSGPKATVFLLLLIIIIPLVNWSAVNVTAEVNDFKHTRKTNPLTK